VESIERAIAGSPAHYIIFGCLLVIINLGRLSFSWCCRGRREGRKMAGVEARVSLEDLKKKMADFAKERDWDQFHSPRNLLLALVCCSSSQP